MAEGEGLSRAFAERHPGEAAMLLETLAEDEVAAYLAELPVPVAATVLAAMLPGPAAGVLDRLGPEIGADLLTALGPERAATALRNLVPKRREALLGRLRPGRRAAVARLLRYVPDTVGAWIEPRILSLRQDATVAWARRAVAAARAPAETELYVVDASHRLVGRLPLGRLLRSDVTARLERVMARRPAALTDATEIGEARHDSSWVGLAALPVVDSGGYLLGELTEEALERALGRHRAREARTGTGALEALADTYLHAGTGFLREVWSLLAPAAGSHREDSP
ncbi:magnesium transporter MgtE N-terminal domain-containing protein [Thiohalorhabdus sp.]|uniref:magnesium transporter MgtE N-terminal domain-containing protein n=1 Tax=Thiohalorhabdus sp. TaxID=3094134 RepID=UPI002FC31AD6